MIGPCIAVGTMSPALSDIYLALGLEKVRK